MDIKQELLFDHCENCPEFILSVKEQIFYADNKCYRELLVTCKNSWLCRQIAERVTADVKTGKNPV